METKLTLPDAAKLWQYDGADVFILGTAANSDGLTIWAANRITGKRVDAKLSKLVPSPLVSPDTVAELVERCKWWARDGNADAAWWLGWYFDGTNLAKSVWYYLAAIRREPKAYGWFLLNLYSNATYGVFCDGVPYPDITFMKAIPEFKDWNPSENWQEAIGRAEAAMHTPATLSQMEEALHLLAMGKAIPEAAWSAGLTKEGLLRSAEYEQWTKGWCDAGGTLLGYGTTSEPGHTISCELCGRSLKAVAQFGDFGRPAYPRHKRSPSNRGLT